MKVLLLLLALLCIVMPASAYNIVGDTVYENSTVVNLSATPHTILSTGWVYFTVDSHTFTGDFDVAWGFNTSESRPTWAELYSPHWVNTTSQHSKTFYNVSSFSPYTGDVLDYGNPYNTNYSYTAVHEVITYNETTMEPEGSEWLTSNASFDSFVNVDGNYTVTWHNRHDKWTLWKDKTDTFNKITHDYEGYDTWYYIKDIAVVAGQSYLLRAWVEVPISLTPSSGKFYHSVWPSTKTISEAITDGNFYSLDPWWNSSWTYYKTITINQTMVNQSIGNVHYTLLVDITDTDLRDHAQADGDDIVFTDSTNTTQLDHQISSYNTTTGALVAYINVTDISNVTSINMYYNNSGATDTQDKAGTWGVNASGIWLMDEGAGSWANDSSGNDNNGTITGADWVADGLDFVAANNDYVAVGDVINDWSTGTIIAEIASDEAATALHIIYSGGGGTTNRVYLAQHGTKWAIRLGVSDYLDSSAANIITGNFYKLTGTWDANSYKLYENGTNVASVGSAPTGQIGDSNSDKIGELTTVSETYNFEGQIKYIYIYNRALSADEISTTYNNTNFPSLFISVGAEQSDAAGNAPNITSWENNETNNNTLDFNITVESINFNATANQTITTWNWYVDDVDQSNNYDNFTTSWTTTGVKHVVVNATNTNGTSTSITWNVTVDPRFDINITFLNRSHDPNMIFEVSNITVDTWGFNYSLTENTHTYYWRYANETLIQSLTATSDNQTLNFSVANLLPAGTYHLNESAVSDSSFTVSLPAGQTAINFTATTCKDTLLEPGGQTAGIPIVNVSNTGDITQSFRFYINSTVSNVLTYTSLSSDLSNPTEINTTTTTVIITNLPASNSDNVWMYCNLSTAPPGDFGKQLTINSS